MAIKLEDARKVAKLARIRVTDDELPAITNNLSAILVFMESLDEVDVEGVEAMSSVTPMHLKQRTDNVLSGDRSKVLSNAPDAREGFYVVPKVIE